MEETARIVPFSYFLEIANTPQDTRSRTFGLRINSLGFKKTEHGETCIAIQRVAMDRLYTLLGFRHKSYQRVAMTALCTLMGFMRILIITDTTITMLDQTTYNIIRSIITHL